MNITPFHKAFTPKLLKAYTDALRTKEGVESLNDKLHFEIKEKSQIIDQLQKEVDELKAKQVSVSNPVEALQSMLANITSVLPESERKKINLPTAKAYSDLNDKIKEIHKFAEAANGLKAVHVG